MIAREDLARDIVIVACAISAGIHAALAPEHFAESTAAGGGFLVAAVALAALAAALSLWPASTAALAGATVVFLGLLASYALAISTGLPLLHPEPEAIDGLALATKAVELAGLLAAGHLLGHGRPAVALVSPSPKGILR